MNTDLAARLTRWANARERRNSPGGHGKTGTALLREAATELERSVSYEEVLQHLLAAHGEHLRTTESDPLSLGDFVTLNYVNPLYARAKAHAEAHPERVIRFESDDWKAWDAGGPSPDPEWEKERAAEEDEHTV